MIKVPKSATVVAIKQVQTLLMLLSSHRRLAKSCFQWHHRLIRFFNQIHFKLSQQITSHRIHLNKEKVKLTLQKSDLFQVNGSSLSQLARNGDKVSNICGATNQVFRIVTQCYLNSHLPFLTEVFYRVPCLTCCLSIIKLYCTKIRCTAMETWKSLLINYLSNSAWKRRPG